MAEWVLHDIKVMGLIPVWVHYWWIQIFGVYKFYMANWMVVTRILHSSCKIVSEYPKYELCQLYNFVHCKKKYRPEKMVRKDVSAVEGTTLKKYFFTKKNCCFSDGVASRSPHRPSSSRNRKVDRVQDLSPGIHVTSFSSVSYYLQVLFMGNQNTNRLIR